MFLNNTKIHQVRQLPLDRLKGKTCLVHDFSLVNPVRNSSGALNPAGTIPRSNPASEQRGIISNGVELVTLPTKQKCQDSRPRYRPKKLDQHFSGPDLFSIAPREHSDLTIKLKGPVDLLICECFREIEQGD
jgi:hypothetical protein